MGNPVSKIGHEIKQDPGQKNSQPATPILTPKLPKSQGIYADPRSPSANIYRTPIEILSSPASEFGGRISVEIPCKLLEADPRSPTSEFSRTPIFVKTSKSDTLLQTKSFESVRKTILCTNAYKTLKLEHEQKENTLPKLIESTTKFVKQAEKRKSFAGLLETNLDFIETDLDDTIFKRNSLQQGGFPATLPIFESENADPRSPTIDFLRTPVQTAKKIGEIDVNKNENDTETIMNTSENLTAKETLDKSPILTTETETTSKDLDLDLEAPADIDSNLLEDLNASFTKVEETKACEDNVAQQIRSMEKMLTNIEQHSNAIAAKWIYEQDVEVPKQRKPLGDTNFVTNKPCKLKVNDKPRASKIPVYKNKVIKGQLLACENTPPKSAQTAKSKPKSDWDGNKTIII